MITSLKNKPMRIGIDGRELLRDQLVGISRYLLNFLKAAVVIAPETTFVVYGNQHTEMPLEASNITFRRLKETRTLWWDQVTLPKAANKDRLDVFLSPYDKGPLRISCPLVLTVHDMLFLYISEHTFPRKQLYNLAYKTMRRPMFAKAKRIITDSNYSRADITALMEVSPQKIDVIYIGISENYTPIQNEQILQDFKARHQIAKPFVLYVGNFNPHKNVSVLIKAFSALPKYLRDTYQLVLCGRPSPFRNHIAGLAKTFKTEDQIRFIDFVEEKDMPTLYSAATVFAFPSLYEGFGLPPLEAMACGTPVVSSSFTSLAEVIENAGLVVDATQPDSVRQGIQTLLNSPDIRKEYIQKGYERVKTFTIEKSARQILRTLSEAAKAHRERS